MDKNINFYTIDKMKKYLSKVKDEVIKENCGIGLTQHMLICGATNSGKSNTLLNFIERTSRGKGTFAHVYMVVKKMEAFNRFLQEELANGLTIIDDLSKIPKVSEFQDLSDKNDKYYLFIFDDCVNDRGKVSQVFEDYFTFGRAKGIHCVFLTQSYFQTNIYIRKQCSWLIICGIRSNGDLERILNDHSFGTVSKEQMISMYNYCKKPYNKGDKNEINFMKVCTFQCPKDKKISKNWLDYLSAKNFINCPDSDEEED
jgi:hypothetical protein